MIVITLGDFTIDKIENYLRRQLRYFCGPYVTICYSPVSFLLTNKDRIRLLCTSLVRYQQIEKYINLLMVVSMADGRPSVNNIIGIDDTELPHTRAAKEAAWEITRDVWKVPNYLSECY